MSNSFVKDANYKTIDGKIIVTDWLDNTWAVGDKIIYLTSSGHTPVYNVGLVENIVEVKKDYTYVDGLKVIVRPLQSFGGAYKTDRTQEFTMLDDGGYGYRPVDKTVILKMTRRIMRFPEPTRDTAGDYSE